MIVAFAGRVPANGMPCGMQTRVTDRHTLAAPPLNVNTSRHDIGPFRGDVQGPQQRLGVSESLRREVWHMGIMGLTFGSTSGPAFLIGYVVLWFDFHDACKNVFASCKGIPRPKTKVGGLRSLAAHA
jgi:hypothetical protein